MKFLLSATLLLLSIITSAQIRQTIYYSESWKICKAEEATIVRQTIVDTSNIKFVGPFRDVYAGGLVATEGHYDNIGLKNGYFTEYYPNGQVKSEGLYIDNVRDSLWTFYDEKGQMRTRILFAAGEYNVLYHSDSSNSITDGTGRWTYTYSNIGESAKYTISGRFLNSKREGWWTLYNENGSLIVKERYKKGSMKQSLVHKGSDKPVGKYKKPVLSQFPRNNKYLITEDFYLADSSVVENYPFLKGKLNRTGQSFYTIVDKVAEYSKGKETLYRTIGKRMNITGPARKNGISGTIIIEFIIDEQGVASEFQVKQSLGYGLDEEALRVVKSLGSWIPAEKDGRPVASKFSLPIVVKTIY